MAALLLVLAVALGVRLVNLRWMAGQPISRFQVAWGESDMATHWHWAGRILEGDLLTREPYQPYPSWMQQIAPLETWNRWRGAHALNKAPLYPYLLAGMRALVGDGYGAIGLCHVALGVLDVALVFLLAARYFDGATALAAGLGAALYGPFLLYETLWLRDTLGVTVSLLLVLALGRCMTAAPGPWVLAGIAFAVTLLAREVVAPFGLLVAFWIWQRHRGHPSEIGRAFGAFLLGVAIGLAPLVARNLAAGAPPLALSAIGVENIVYGHAVDSAPAKFKVPAATAEILRAADGHVLATIRGTLATYDGDWMRLVRNEARRTAAVFSALEGSDNVNWYFFAERSPVLAYALRWEVVLALGLVGICLARRRIRGDDCVVLYYLVLSLAALQAVPVMGRYRIVPAAFLLVYAAVTVVTVARGLRSGAWRMPVAAAAASAALVFVSTRLLLAPDVHDRCRPSEYLTEVQVALARRDGDAALGMARRCLECVAAHADAPTMLPEFQGFARDFATLARQLGRDTDAAALLERLSAVYPDDPVLPALRSAARAPEDAPAP
jgi:hypothetical protein